MSIKRKSSQREKKFNPPLYKNVVEGSFGKMLYASASKSAGDSRLAETRTYNASSPAFKRLTRSKLPISKPNFFDAAIFGTNKVDAAVSGVTVVTSATVADAAHSVTERDALVQPQTKRKQTDEHPMEGIYESMKKLKTDDECTKRFLLGLHYMNVNAPTREITLNATTGDITLGKYL